MAAEIIVDAGPLVALLVAGDEHHAWATKLWGTLEPPLLTCEAVVSEAQFVISRLGGDPLKMMEFLKRGMLTIAFTLESEHERIMELQRTYRTVPMSLADACLVRMTELRDHARVVTTDSDFRIYRRNRRQIIPLIAPPGL